MSAFLSFEALKISKRWMPRIILLLLLGLTAVAIWGQGTRSGSGAGNVFLPRGWLAALVYCSFFAPFFWPVLGGSWAGSEYGWGTIRSILTRRPQRIEHVVAALVVLLLGVAVGILAIMGIASLASLLVAGTTGHTVFTSGIWGATFLGTVAKGFLTTWFVSAFYLVLAYTAATVFRSTAVGIGLGIGGTFAQLILGHIFAGLGGIWNDIALQFPFHYSGDLITQVTSPGLIPGSSLATASPGDPTVGASLLVLTIYSAIFMAITFAAVRARDVTD